MDNQTPQGSASLLPANAPELSLIEKAEQLKSQIEEQNKKQEELIRRQEEILSKQILGGKSSFSQTPQKTPEDINKEVLKSAYTFGLNPFKGAGARALEMNIKEGTDGGYTLA